MRTRASYLALVLTFLPGLAGATISASWTGTGTLLAFGLLLLDRSSPARRLA